MTIAVVGGGPSGMLAAVLLARAGNDVELLDEHAQVGGHLTYDIYQLPGGGSSVVLLAELEAAVRCSGAGLGVDSVVWGAFRSVAGIELTINRMGASSSTLCQRAIFATGATNRAIALPGGTLPGVMTASAVRILGERHGVVPAERFAIIGSGDEAQRLAQDIGAWGARVEAIVNPASVRRIVGTDSVQAVELVQGTFEVDVVAIAVGELPDTQLPGMLELQRVYDPTLGGWRIEPPTGIEQVGVVGGAALGGARIGDVLRSAIDIVAGIMGAGAVQLTDLKAVNSVLWSDGEGAIVNPGQAYLCRCECVSGEAVQAAIDEGNLTINDIKRRTRAGMGICQGIFCVDQIARRLVEHGVDPATIAPMTARPPTRLITLTVAASSANEG